MTSNQQQFFNAIPKTWQKHLQAICHNSQIDQLCNFLKLKEASGATIYPAKQDILGALQATPFDIVKVVIVGQDPYHGPNQAHGLSFSVKPGVVVPPSLKNIFKELKSDLGIDFPKNYGYLNGWAQQGVLLLNSILTVEAGLPASHANLGWELFTDEILLQLLQKQQPQVFMLWGAYAQKKVQKLAASIDTSKHLILKAGHPSPLSVRHFLGCKHFSQANNFLCSKGLQQIDWLAIR